MKVLVTGAAGFIGYHLCRRLYESGHAIVGIDSMNAYYDVALKEMRLASLKELGSRFQFHKLDICDRGVLFALIKEGQFDAVCSLAAQAGVRYSIQNPYTYVENNVAGFLNILEVCVQNQVPYLVYASSSSVYGRSGKQPFAESDQVDTPVSLYAATKKADELMAHVYSQMYGLPTVGLRFFTVYGPYGRPDMAYFKFADKIERGQEIEVYNNGQMKRDFTYIDDVTAGIEKVLTAPYSDKPKYRIYNIGRGKPENLMDFIHLIEKGLDKKASLKLMPLQKGDVLETFADISALKRDFGYEPETDLEEGIAKFLAWFKAYMTGGDN
jgi:UDP-glucuronate 4-epimerase